MAAPVRPAASKKKINLEESIERSQSVDFLRNSRINKGLAFTLKERQVLGIHGLLPPQVRSQDQQLRVTLKLLDRHQDDLDKYIFLNALQARNEKLFYRMLAHDIEKMMPLVYTPTVGLACQKFGIIVPRPQGLYITIHDIGYVYEILSNWPESDIRAIVVTDGERILGLGDLGASGMGIPVGKLTLYTALAGIQPKWCLPVVLDVGTNNEEMLADPDYVGLRHQRVQGPKYFDLVDEFMDAVVRRYGQTCLVQFEDFAAHNAFRFIQKYQQHYCMFNDDVQGTAAVVVAGIFASVRMTGKKLSENKFVFLGAGNASLGIANLLVLAMRDEGLSEAEAVQRVWMLDKHGLLSLERNLSDERAIFAKDHPTTNSLEEIVLKVQPTMLFGASATPGTFTQTIIQGMCDFNERPVIFALSNPTSKAECTAGQAYTYSQGRCIFASGSPFPPFTLEGKTFYPAQGNNAYIFPGVALGAIVCGVKHIDDHMFLIAAKTLAEMVSMEHLDEGRVYPPLSSIPCISLQVAVAIAEKAYKDGTATFYPEPEDKKNFIQSQLYTHQYENFLPSTYEWPNAQE